MNFCHELLTSKQQKDEGELNSAALLRRSQVNPLSCLPHQALTKPKNSWAALIVVRKEVTCDSSGYYDVFVYTVV